MKTKKQFAIYCRVSTEEQKSIYKQEEICLEYLKRNDLGVYKVYKDISSGLKSSRPAFNKMLEDMRRFEFDGIICSRLDRIGRSLQHLISLFQEFDKKSIYFISVSQNIETLSSSGRLQFQILAAFSEFESALISERTKEGLARAKNKGKRGKDKKQRSRRWLRKPISAI